MSIVPTLVYLLVEECIVCAKENETLLDPRAFHDMSLNTVGQKKLGLVHY